MKDNIKQIINGCLVMLRDLGVLSQQDVKELYSDLLDRIKNNGKR